MLLDYLTPERIVLEGRAADKRGVLEELAALLATGLPDVTSEAILQALLEREAVMSTGIGQGFAIPHARIDDVDKIRLALVRYRKGIEFDALDGRPIHLAFGVIGPPAGSGQHVKLLAGIARLVKQEGAENELLTVTSVQDLVDVLARRNP